MINLSYRYDQNSSSLALEGMPDVSSGDSDQTIGILSSWTLKIIGSPLLEGKKEHLDSLMHVILQYSRSYISGIRKSYVSTENIVSISPFGKKHKLLLISTQQDVKPLEIILDDSELSDLTRCFDLLRFDKRVSLQWNFVIDQPFRIGYINSNLKTSKKYIIFISSFIIFLSASALLALLPIKNKNEIIETKNTNSISLEQSN